MGSESAGSLTPAGRQAMIDYGVGTVIDLRSESEVKGAPGPPFSEFQSSSPATAITDGAIPVYLNIPLIDDATAPILNEAPPMPQRYILILPRRQPAFASAFQPIPATP